MSDDEKKIIIDEDWKASVQREREEGVDEAVEEAAAPQGAEESFPEASFDSLVGSLATQTLFALGLIAPQGQEQVAVDLDQARYTIDTLIVLREKTKDNLEPEEEGALTEAVTELERVFVARVQQQQEEAMRASGVDLTNLRTE